MSEITIGQVIKLILGILVIVAVVFGLSVFFKGKLSNLFSFIGEEDSSQKVSTQENNLGGESENLVGEGLPVQVNLVPIGVER